MGFLVLSLKNNTSQEWKKNQPRSSLSLSLSLSLLSTEIQTQTHTDTDTNTHTHTHTSTNTLTNKLSYTDINFSLRERKEGLKVSRIDAE
jgi:hypothetical protein